jgi:phosphocarrier protein HPr
MTQAARTITIVNQRGLHARAAAKFSKLAAQYPSEISVSNGDIDAPGRSILDLLMLAASKGKQITITCQGTDAARALAALCDLVERGFDEDDNDHG